MPPASGSLPRSLWRLCVPFLWVSLRLFCCVAFQIQFPRCGFSWFRSLCCGSASVAVAFIFAPFRAFMLSMGCCLFSSMKALFSPFSALYAVLNFSLYARLCLVVNVHFASLPCVALYLPFLGVLCAFVGFSPSAAFIAVFGSFMRSIVLL